MHNPWAHKPWWCQPWSIFLTGSLLIAASYTWLGAWWILPAIPVLVWMGYFLVVWPRLMSRYLSDAESQSGVE
ncbi:MAG: hypothetical protein H7Y22_13970 [Gemmatimonadaceae bacterium]|nr:hypothetical protein [Gloeobacterales cyanobacterium ES-bin-141]